MNKLKMHSVNKVDENIKRIGELFPNCVTERNNSQGEVEYAIDFDVLKQELSDVVVEGNEERYQFTWPDKKKSILLANAPITKTLRPCREESVDFDNTENLYIEGDNLDVLKLLQETYLGKIKMIYIDPPYNTGNDFVYNDDFAESADEYLANSGQFDEEGNRLVTNTESNGRFHTDWLNMLYPRLKVAKDLLSDDGVIFISIDENEVENAKKMCNEVFGYSNLLGTFIWRKKDGGGQTKEAFVIEHEYVLVYRKSVHFVWIDKVEMRSKSEYNKTDAKGIFKITKLAKWGNTARREDRPSMYFPITAPDGTNCYPIAPDGGDGRWRVGVPRMNDLITNDLVHWEKKSSGWIPYEKEYYANQSKIIKERSILYNLANTGDGSNILTNLFEKKDTFENPKPVELINLFLECAIDSDDIVLDFFSGSATTAHAVMQLNAKDGGNRKFIMVQLPEETDEKSEAYKAGYKNICEIGKERIRRAGVKIQAENEKLKEVTVLETEEDVQLFVDIAKNGPDAVERTKSAFKHHDISKSLDTGFRVLKLDSSNMKDVYYNPAEYDFSLFETLADNIKEDRTPEDLLFQVMLDLGILLSSKIEETTIGDKKVFNVADGFLYACFDNNVTEDVITEIAKKQPYYFVMRDSSMASDSVATNCEQIFNTYSPDTVRKVL